MNYLFDTLQQLVSPTLTRLEETPTNTTTLSSRKHNNNQTTALIIEIVLNVGFAVSLGLLARYMIEKMTSQYEDKDRPPPKIVKDRLSKILSKRNITEIPTLDSYELQMAEVIVDPDDIDSSFADVGGLDDTKREIYELAVLPLVQPELFQGKLVQPTKGILLYGRPGTGKTMMAKALAKEAQAVFIPLQLSKILNKWVGESNKLVAATFSLAHKLQPSIIFIDELDTFLRSSNADNAYLDTIKSEFLVLWDGVTTAHESRVLILGATNKPHSIDPAIQRRMPRTFLVPLPDLQGRLAILELLLKDEKMETSARKFLPELADKTKGYSGSDLKELCKAAAMVSIQERTKEFASRRVRGENVTIAAAKLPKSRPISKNDLVLARSKVGPTGAAAQKYGRDTAAEDQRSAVDLTSLNQLAQLLRSISNISEAPMDSDAIPDLN